MKPKEAFNKITELYVCLFMPVWLAGKGTLHKMQVGMYVCLNNIIFFCLKENDTFWLECPSSRCSSVSSITQNVILTNHLTLLNNMIRYIAYMVVFSKAVKRLD